MNLLKLEQKQRSKAWWSLGRTMKPLVKRLRTVPRQRAQVQLDTSYEEGMNPTGDHPQQLSRLKTPHDKEQREDTTSSSTGSAYAILTKYLKLNKPPNECQACVPTLAAHSSRAVKDNFQQMGSRP